MTVIIDKKNKSAILDLPNYWTEEGVAELLNIQPGTLRGKKAKITESICIQIGGKTLWDGSDIVKIAPKKRMSLVTANLVAQYLLELLGKVEGSDFILQKHTSTFFDYSFPYLLLYDKKKIDDPELHQKMKQILIVLAKRQKGEAI